MDTSNGAPRAKGRVSPVQAGMAGTRQGAEELNLSQLRAILSEEIQNIREGQTTAANVNAICNATGKILSTVKLQMEYYKQIGKTPVIPLLLGEGSPAE